MTVLVTRPGQQGQALCQQLNDQGIPALHHPLISIEAGEQLSSLSSILHQFDIIIAVSQHAVDFAHTHLSNHNLTWPTSATYLAVGQKTAHNLSNSCHQTVHYPQVSDSEHLLEISQLQRVNGKKVLILRGNGGRELIYDTLVERGAEVEYCAVYERKNLEFRSDLMVPLWQDKQVTQLIITSSGQLEHFWQQIDPRYTSWLLQLALYVPSERIAIEARRFGFCNVISTGSASNRDLLATLWPNEQDENNDQ
ncbi:uroporphyrinogen-III synthase [Vibrio sp. LaRot3]|uniref:uroporphyrinogen-III synthase n=1 Tax=Vibrio sp. LaRot3 TaxID=2998829 RepID=UPI0022CDDF87|nr:uroporphyrinogen-III synthase [Vibrio sp. LaRot3]MDA0150339.1 uroporphyrinogen-III synthase [Vibrio sp. LaRot3]